MYSFTLFVILVTNGDFVDTLKITFNKLGINLINNENEKYTLNTHSVDKYKYINKMFINKCL